MDHQKAAELLSAYIEGELPADTRAELEAHLAVCIQCRTELTALRRTLQRLTSLKEAAPRDFLANVQQQIFVRSRGRFFGGRWKLFGRIPYAWLSLAMIIVMLVYYITVLRGSPTGVKPVP